MDINIKIKWFYVIMWKNLKYIFAKWNKPDTKGGILYDSTYMTF